MPTSITKAKACSRMQKPIGINHLEDTPTEGTYSDVDTVVDLATYSL